MKLTLHTKGIKGASVMEPGEDPGVLFGAIVEVDGEIALTAHKVVLTFEEEPTKALIELYPTGIEVVVHDKETWEVFNERVDAKWKAATARTGMGQAIARHTPDE